MLEVVRGGTGLRQGCVLSPLVFSDFFAAMLVLLVVPLIERFREDADILADLVHGVLKSSRRLNLKRHWNAHGVLFEGCWM